MVQKNLKGTMITIVKSKVSCTLPIRPLKGIIFTVYFGDNMPLFTEKILFDSSRWYDDFLAKIDFLYQRAFFAGLFTRRVQVVGFHIDIIHAQGMV